MDLSILLVQYRPDEGELRRTLASLLRPSWRGFLTHRGRAAVILNWSWRMTAPMRTSSR